MTSNGYAFNPPPGWLVPGGGWVPPEGWTPNPSWPPAPADWVFWIPAVPATTAATSEPTSSASPAAPQGSRAAPGAVLRQHSSTAGNAPDTVSLELRARIAELEAEVNRLDSAAARPADSEVVDLDDERVLQEVGIYRYHHPLENAAEYKVRLAVLNEQIKELVKQRKAVLASDMFTFNNSLAKGRKMTSEFRS